MDINITLIIILITAGVSFMAWNNKEIYDKLIFNPYSVFHRSQWYRLFSSGLLHADVPHLVINMFVLFSFGNFIEEVYQIYLPFGLPMFVLMYILSIGAANIKTLFQHKDNVWYNAVGASGAVSAVIFAFVLVAPLEKIYLFAIVPIPAFLYGFLYLAYSQYMAKKASDNIGHDAHFYGAFFGFIFTGLLRPELFILFVQKIFKF